MHILALIIALFLPAIAAVAAPNIVLLMTDDQGWGQMGYYKHPVLKTPNLDAMAANGLRLDRFYAGAPNCSPTRASVLTGRSNDRTGTENHGYALRLQEKVLPRAMKDAGYATGHFGKWHLNGFSGVGAPILETDDHSPGHFGFEEWVSVTNFFDRDPLMSRKGKFEAFKGDSSEIIVGEALKFIGRQTEAKRPFFAVIWYGSPHDPFEATDADMEPFKALKPQAQKHYGELVAMDRSIGALRKGLRDHGVAENTLVWFNSDNGGLPGIEPDTVGGLRGFKNTVYEGGLRVPAVIEWPARIKAGRISKYPAATMDIFPTVAEIAALPASAMLQPQDGLSLMPLFDGDLERRAKPIPFRHAGRGAWIDNDLKLVTQSVKKGEFELYNLAADPAERTNLLAAESETAAKLTAQFKEWNASVDRSFAGKDYPEGRASPNEPARQAWDKSPQYAPFLDEIKKHSGKRPRE